MNSIKVNYVPTEKQALFHGCGAEVVLYGGAAGGGKTKALLMEAFVRMLELPGSHGMLMRLTYPELEKSLILESLKIFPREICKYNEVKHRWTIKTGREDSFLDFGFCRVDTDVYDYQSAEYDFLGIDELTHFNWHKFSYLMSRVRSSKKGGHPVVRCASNPGNVGHYWVKKYFKIKEMPPGETFTPEPSDEDPQPLSRCYIPARVADNPHLAVNDPAYIRRLNLLPLVQRRMLLEGDWTSFAGRFFDDFKKVHVISPIPIPLHWKKWRTVDYGFTAPFCCLWIALSPEGKFYVYRELYVTGLRDVEQAQWIKRYSDESVEYTVGDPSMGAKRGGTGSSPQENYASQDVMVFPGNNARVPGWMSVRNLLALDAQGSPGIFIFDSCKNLIREFENAVTDSRNLEDLDTDGEDHALDALRYFTMSRPETSKIPVEDQYAGMDRATMMEWKDYHKMIKGMSLNQDKNSMYNFNEDLKS